MQTTSFVIILIHVSYLIFTLYLHHKNVKNHHFYVKYMYIVMDSDIFYLLIIIMCKYSYLFILSSC